MMWTYAALVFGALVIALGLRQRRLPKRNRIDRIDVGPLSKSWLAEQRSQHDDQP